MLSNPSYPDFIKQTEKVTTLISQAMTDSAVNERRVESRHIRSEFERLSTIYKEKDQQSDWDNTEQHISWVSLHSLGTQAGINLGGDESWSEGLHLKMLYLPVSVPDSHKMTELEIIEKVKGVLGFPHELGLIDKSIDLLMAPASVSVEGMFDITNRLSTLEYLAMSHLGKPVDADKLSVGARSTVVQSGALRIRQFCIPVLLVAKAENNRTGETFRLLEDEVLKMRFNDTFYHALVDYFEATVPEVSVHGTFVEPEAAVFHLRQFECYKIACRLKNIMLNRDAGSVIELSSNGKVFSIVLKELGGDYIDADQFEVPTREMYEKLRAFFKRCFAQVFSQNH